MRLQRFRLKSGWSKRVVANKLGVSIPSIIRWEEGTSEPNDYNRYKIELLLADGRSTQSPLTSQKRIVQLNLFAGRREEIG
jgi:transcriptional regulator with XRE-family HTH domain